MELNPQQSAVVNALTGPCLVIAGAGSGKTRVIINKIKRLLATGISPRSIYAVTFTNKAASEMKERLRLEMPKASAVQISTFHTLGLEIVKAEHRALALKQKVILTDTHDQRVLLRDLLMSTTVVTGDIEGEITTASEFISKAKNALLLPGDLPSNPQAFTNNPIFIEHYHHFSKIYHYYFSYMQSISSLDFDDLILLPTLLLMHDEQIRHKYQHKIQYLLVDEYQDTNISQYELVKQLVGIKANFTVVGDDDQSIYSWRGAEPQNLYRLKQDFPQLQVFYLEQNYRSTENILHTANELIAHNDHIYDKKLKTSVGKGKPVKIIGHDNPDEEAYEVVQDIIQKKHDLNLNWGDFAVLYRGNHQSRLLEKEFQKEDIPVLVNGDASFFNKSEIKDYIAYLRVLSNFDDDKSLMRIINVPRRDIGSKTILGIGEVAKNYNCSFFDACEHPDLLQYIRGKAYNTLHEFLDLLIRTQTELEETDDFNVLKEFFANLNYAEFLFEQSGNAKTVEAQLENIKQLMNMIERWMTGKFEEPLTLSEVCQRLFLREMYANQAADNPENFVQLMTIHASKGLEFPVVHIIGCEEDTIPHKTSIEEDNVEEERRLMYVGITRAKQDLTLHYSDHKRTNNETVQLEPSRFLEELPASAIVHDKYTVEKTEKNRKQQQKSNLDRLLNKLSVQGA